MNAYESLDLQTLIGRCREHDDGAFAELVNRYTPMLNKVVSSFVDGSVTSDELFAEACIGLHQAARKFDLVQTGVTFGLYARICVYNRVVDFMRNESTSRLLVELDAEAVAAESEELHGILTRDMEDRLFARARDILSEYEYKVLILHSQGYKTAHIAAALGREAKSIDNAKSRIFRRLREQLGSFLNN